eukprot:TRINITY_DN1063_c0_g1_i2.p1 TRINITY_DN1063_c0_g1~~TRINITY_DN1063_c0_g1_i2.p1  ORF type:complete len:520 (+),score=70.68 TRINITY_DN1063_c0_g1_i2:770-2329(+)
MNRDEFIEYIKAEDDSIISANLVDNLFAFASKRTNSISFTDFVNFNLCMTGPDADLKILFFYFEKNNEGRITLKRFIKTCQLLKLPMNFQTDYFRRFFDQNGSLDFNGFCQVIKEIDHEWVNQSFNTMQNNGLITGEQFKQILLEQQSHRTILDYPPHIFNRIEEIAGQELDYSSFRALYNVLSSLDRVNFAIKKAINDSNEASITEKEFLRSARRLKLQEYTPLESYYVFAIFDRDRDGKISEYDYKYNMLRLDDIQPAKKGFIHEIIEVAEHFTIGSIAGAIGAFSVYPIDLVKTRMQNQRVKDGLKLYKNSFHCFYTVIKTEGPIGLYRGLLPQLVGVAPEKAIKLSVNDLLRKLFTNEQGGEIYFPLQILAGAGAGASQVIFTNPLEIVKIRLQTQGEIYRLTGAKPKSVLTVLRELGLFGLYKGAASCLLRDIPFSGIYFPTYGLLKREFHERGWYGWSPLLLAGAVAGIPAAFFVTPADVIKTRLQVKPIKGQQVYKNIPDAVGKVRNTLYRY